MKNKSFSNGVVIAAVISAISLLSTAMVVNTNLLDAVWAQGNESDGNTAARAGPVSKSELEEIKDLCKTVATFAGANITESDCDSISIQNMQNMTSADGKTSAYGLGSLGDAIKAILDLRKLPKSCPRPGTCVDGKLPPRTGK